MVLVIPAEGDSAETELWYLQGLQNYYSQNGQSAPIVHVYRDTSTATNLAEVRRSIRNFFQNFDSELGYKAIGLEVHAQGGYGAIVLYIMAIDYPDRINYGFFIGGAPGNTMTPIAKVFHTVIARLWYWSHIPFFADDPNPHRATVVESIRASSTRTMNQDRRKYCRQLNLLAKWRIQDSVHFGWKPQLFFVPNGLTVRPTWWDNTYDDEKARAEWVKHGVTVTNRPKSYFSFYSLYPWDELFKVMDEARAL